MIDKDAEKRAIDGGLEVSIGKKNVGGLTAQLEGDALHRVRGLLDDDLAHGRAAGEGNLIDIRMLRPAERHSFRQIR